MRIAIYFDARPEQDDLFQYAMGLLMDPNQPEEWAKAIVLLFNDQPLRQRLIRLRFQRHQGWDLPQFDSELGRILERCRTL